MTYGCLGRLSALEQMERQVNGSKAQNVGSWCLVFFCSLTCVLASGNWLSLEVW